MSRLARWVLYAFVASIPLEDVVSVASVGRVSRLLGLLAFVAWAGTVVARGRLRRPPAVVAIALCFVAWAASSYFWSSDPLHTVPKVFTFVQLFSIIVLVWDQVRTEAMLARVGRAFVLGGVGASLLTIEASRRGEAVEGTARFAATNAGPNYTGCVLVVAIALAWLLLRADPDRRYRALYATAIAIGVVGSLLTASRTALVALLLVGAVAFLDARQLRFRRLAALAAGGTLLVVVALALVPQGSIDRLSTTQGEISGGTLNDRTTYWSVAWDLFGDHPLLGVGTNMFERSALEVTGEEVVAHNLFISTVAELGLVGLALLVALVVTIVYTVFAHAPALARRPWLAVLTAWLVGASTLTWETRKVTWFLAAIGIAAAGARRAARPAEDATPTLAGAAPR